MEHRSRIEEEFSDVTLVDSNLPASELDQCFRGKRDIGDLAGASTISKTTSCRSNIATDHTADVEDSRLYVSDRLFDIYSTLLTLHGRTAMLITMSFKDKRLYDWRTDGSLNGTLRKSLDAGPIEAAKRMPLGGIKALIAELESQFQREAAAV